VPAACPERSRTGVRWFYFFLIQCAFHVFFSYFWL
jgi:hypothetical protein